MEKVDLIGKMDPIMKAISWMVTFKDLEDITLLILISITRENLE